MLLLYTYLVVGTGSLGAIFILTFTFFILLAFILLKYKYQRPVIVEGWQKAYGSFLMASKPWYFSVVYFCSSSLSHT